MQTVAPWLMDDDYWSILLDRGTTTQKAICYVTAINAMMKGKCPAHCIGHRARVDNETCTALLHLHFFCSK